MSPRDVRMLSSVDTSTAPRTFQETWSRPVLRRGLDPNDGSPVELDELDRLPGAMCVL